MRTGQPGPLTSSQRLRDDLLGSEDVRDPIDRVGQLHPERDDDWGDEREAVFALIGDQDA